MKNVAKAMRKISEGRVSDQFKAWFRDKSSWMNLFINCFCRTQHKNSSVLVNEELWQWSSEAASIDWLYPWSLSGILCYYYSLCSLMVFNYYRVSIISVTQVHLVDSLIIHQVKMYFKILMLFNGYRDSYIAPPLCYM